jgi:hypothetical protein
MVYLRLHILLIKGATMQEPIIHRLMNEKPDGSVEVVGYQKQVYGDIGHYTDLWMVMPEDIVLPAHDIICPGAINSNACFKISAFIKHTRIDRWTGLKYPDGRLVFERDYIKNNDYPMKWKLKVKYGYGCWIWQRYDDDGNEFADNGSLTSILDNCSITFLGIEGIKESNNE